jgi:hypothetical protein
LLQLIELGFTTSVYIDRSNNNNIVLRFYIQGVAKQLAGTAMAAKNLLPA